jgi:hypothetical protein
MVVAGEGEAPVPCLLGEGRPEPPSPLEAVRNSSVEFPIMACSGDGGPLWVEPMKVASEPSPLGERLRPLKQSAMNSRLPKQIVLPREKPPHDRHSPSAAMASMYEGPSEHPEGKRTANPPSWHTNFQYFFTGKI